MPDNNRDGRIRVGNSLSLADGAAQLRGETVDALIERGRARRAAIGDEGDGTDEEQEADRDPAERHIPPQAAHAWPRTSRSSCAMNPDGDIAPPSATAPGAFRRTMPLRSINTVSGGPVTP